MPGRWAYNILYRVGAAALPRGWDKGPRTRAGRARHIRSDIARPREAPRAVDLGCGSGANVVFLADRGFQAVGVDFSKVAIERARRVARDRGLADRARFTVGDVTEPHIEGVAGPFGVVVVYNTLQDLLGEDRRALARLVRSLTVPGSLFLLWCYYEATSALPRFTFSGPSKMFPFVVEPGEEEDLFGDHFAIERLPWPEPETRKASFLMTRR